METKYTEDRNILMRAITWISEDVEDGWVEAQEIVDGLQKIVETMKKDSKMTYDSVSNIVVGQKVWVMPSEYCRGERTPREATVSKIGRKYFELKEFTRCKYRISDGVEENNINYKGKVYIDLQQILDEKERAKISRELRTIFSGYGKLPYDLLILKQVRDLVQD